MKQKYKILTHNGEKEVMADSDLAPYIEYAVELKSEYGLNCWNLIEIARIWHNYSEENYFAGWLTPNKHDVEWAFNVTLEEI